MKALSLANGGAKESRRDLDFYPTPPEASHALMIFLTEENIVNSKTAVWEPACGNGDMSEVIKKYVGEVHSSDLRTTGYGEGGIDFLETELEYDAIITNPPFNVSEEFIRHALQQSDTVAMLLKSQYWHAAKRSKLFCEHPPAWVLPLTWRPDFLFDKRKDGVKGSPTMEVHWTVWTKDSMDTKYRLLNKPKT